MKKSLKFGYLCVEAFLLAAFTWTDAVNRLDLSGRLKFLGIAVNTVAMVFILAERRIGIKKQEERSPDLVRLRWIVFALLLTLAADVFLILLDTRYLLGVLLFCAVECCYAIFLIRGKKWVPDVLLRLGIYAAACIVLKMMDVLDPLTLASVFSMVQLSLNVIFAWKRSAARPGMKMLALGLTLFWCCDACVGLRNIGDYIAEIPSWVPMLAGTVIWWFYLPAQVLILLSLEKMLKTASGQIYKKRKEHG